MPCVLDIYNVKRHSLFCRRGGAKIWYVQFLSMGRTAPPPHPLESVTGYTCIYRSVLLRGTARLFTINLRTKRIRNLKLKNYTWTDLPWKKKIICNEWQDRRTYRMNIFTVLVESKYWQYEKWHLLLCDLYWQVYQLTAISRKFF